MGKAVEKLIKETIGEEVFKNLQKEKRYKVELWSAWSMTHHLFNYGTEGDDY